MSSAFFETNGLSSGRRPVDTRVDCLHWCM